MPAAACAWPLLASSSLHASRSARLCCDATERSKPDPSQIAIRRRGHGNRRPSRPLGPDAVRCPHRHARARAPDRIHEADQHQGHLRGHAGVPAVPHPGRALRARPGRQPGRRPPAGARPAGAAHAAEDRPGHAPWVLRSSLSGAASKARTPAILAPFLPGLESTSQPDVNVPCRPYSSAEQCLCAAP